MARTAANPPAQAAAAAGHASSSGSASTAAAGPAAAAAGRSWGAALLGVPAVTVITPNELAKDLFQWVHDEEVVDALYLQVSWGLCLSLKF